MKLEPIGIERRYFSGPSLRRWGSTTLGDRFSVAELSRVLGWSSTATQHVLDGRGSPNLESYCRAVVRADVPFGTWIDNDGR